jgi:hypothetical protein
LDDLSARLQAGQNPFVDHGTNSWLEADLDLPAIAGAFSLDWNLPRDFPEISLIESGEATNVRTHLELTFARPLPFEFEPWNIPTNIIAGPVTSLAVVRGFRPWLDSLPLWKNLRLGSPPNQLCVWAEQGGLMLTYFAAPWPDASNRVQQITEMALEKRNSGGFTNNDFDFRRALDSNGLEWQGLPFLFPYLQSTRVDGQEFVLGGLFPRGDPRDWPRPNLPSEILAQTNLVSYDWEMTGPRVDSLLYITQFFRHVTRHPQLDDDSVSRRWLQAISPKLGKCVTAVTLVEPDRLSLERKSSLGFSAAELHLLVDWLESPDFPEGLHTFRAPYVAPAAPAAP